MKLFIFVLELIGTAAFAISGALLAAQEHMDLFGVIIMGLVAACGGGVMRDIILGQIPPNLFLNPVYSAVAAGISLIVFIYFLRQRDWSRHRFYSILYFAADTIGLGVFTSVGCIFAIDKGFGFNRGYTAFLGVITGVGGGVLRDILAGISPYILQKHIYATAAIAGGLLFAYLWPYVGQTIAMVSCFSSIIIIRFLAARFHWNLPKAKSGMT